MSTRVSSGTKSILVTGGAGFVGGHLCAALLAGGEHVVALDDLSNGKRENIPAGVPLIEADLADRGWFDQLQGSDVGAVLHLAAQSSNAISFRDPLRDLQANQRATLNVLEFCRLRSIRRLIFTSSMSAYGQPVRLPTPEDEPCVPGSWYGAHKLTSEHYLRIFASTHPLDWTVFRLYTTYGVGQNLANRDQGLIKIFMGFVLRHEPIHVRGPAERIRDCVHVTDVVDAFVRALRNPASFGRTYNVATGRTLTVRQIIDLILAEAGHDPATYPTTFGPLDPGDPLATHGDVSALERDLGWRARTAPEDGIRATVRAYLGSAQVPA